MILSLVVHFKSMSLFPFIDCILKSDCLNFGGYLPEMIYFSFVFTVWLTVPFLWNTV